jgi:hypothetical protein
MGCFWRGRREKINKITEIVQEAKYQKLHFKIGKIKER